MRQPALERRLQRAIHTIERATIEAMEEAAEDLVKLMRRTVRKVSGALARSIDWTWGAAPEGSVTLDTVDHNERRITIHAGHGLENPNQAKWVEFGTAPHNVAKGGGTQAGQAELVAGGGKPHPGARAYPYFFPSYRARKRSIKQRMSRKINKALRRI